MDIAVKLLFEMRQAEGEYLLAQRAYLLAQQAYDSAISQQRRDAKLSVCCGAKTEMEAMDGWTYCDDCGERV